MKNKILSISYICACAVLGCIGGIWMYRLLDAYFNTKTNAFKAPGGSITAISVYIGVGAALLIALGIIASVKTNAEKKMPRGLLLTIAALFFVSGISSLVMIFGASLKQMTTVYKMFTIGDVIFTFVCAVYFIFKAFELKGAEYLSLSLPVWSVLLISSSYFNTDYTYTNYPRTVLSLAVAAMILFSLETVREHLGKRAPWLVCLSSALSVFLGLTYAVSRAVFIISKGIAPKVADSLEFAVIAFAIYAIASNLYKICDAPEEQPKEENDEEKTD